MIAHPIDAPASFLLDSALRHELRDAVGKALRALTAVLDAAQDADPARRPPASQVRLAASQVIRLALNLLGGADRFTLAKPSATAQRAPCPPSAASPKPAAVPIQSAPPSAIPHDAAIPRASVVTPLTRHARLAPPPLAHRLASRAGASP